MLVLSRFVGESIWIDGNIRVTVVSKGNDSVRIGIDAPGLDIVRQELLKEGDERLRMYPRKTREEKFGERIVDYYSKKNGEVQ